MNKVIIIGLNTAKEILRDRILYGLLVFAVLMILMSLLLGELSFAEQSRIVTNMGLLAAELGCAMLAVFIGGSLVYKEIEKQTVLILLSKPVSRGQFLLGKALGLAAVIFIVNVIISGFLAVICLQYGQMKWEQFFWSQFGVMCESVLLLSIALFFGVFSRPVMTVIFTVFAWIIGHSISDLRFFSQKSSSPLVKAFGEFMNSVFPNFESFHFKNAVIYGDVIKFSDIQPMLMMTVGWTILLLFFSTRIFERRDFT